MTTRYCKPVVALAAWAAAAAAVWPYDKPASLSAEELLDRVSARYDAVADFTASLTVVASSALGEESEQTGILYARAPDLFRVDYREPFAQTVVFDGSYMYVVTAGSKQVIRYDGGGFAELFNLSRALKRLKPDYDLALAGETGGRTYELDLRAKAADATFPRIRMWVSRDAYALTRADLDDAAGNTTSYRFSGYTFDAGVPADRFRFTPPPGAEVVDAGAAFGP
jgi:outer membrane lipoprotein carrier protein